MAGLKTNITLTDKFSWGFPDTKPAKMGREGCIRIDEQEEYDFIKYPRKSEVQPKKETHPNNIVLPRPDYFINQAAQKKKVMDNAIMNNPITINQDTYNNSRLTNMRRPGGKNFVYKFFR